MKDELGSAVENSLELIFETRGTIVEQAVIKVKARGDKGMYQSDTCTFGEKVYNNPSSMCCTSTNVILM